MRLVYFTDSHARSLAPISRIDPHFDDTVLGKIREVFQYARDNKAAALICGGDLFDSPQPSLGLIIKMVALLSEYDDIPFYLNVGNHDIYAHQIDTIDRTGVGLLNYIGVINIVDELELDNMLIKFVQYYHGAEEDLKIKDKFGKCDVLVNHAMVVDGTFFGDYVIYNEVNQNYRVMLCSHYHPGFGYNIIGDKHIVAPGAITRTSLDQHNLTRQPSFAVIEIDENTVNCEIIPLKSAKSSEEVFLLQKAIDPAAVDKREELLRNINDLKISACDLPSLVEEYCNLNSIDERIKKECLVRINE